MCGVRVVFARAVPPRHGICLVSLSKKRVKRIAHAKEPICPDAPLGQIVASREFLLSVCLSRLYNLSGVNACHEPSKEAARTPPCTMNCDSQPQMGQFLLFLCDPRRAPLVASNANWLLSSCLVEEGLFPACPREMSHSAVAGIARSPVWHQHRGRGSKKKRAFSWSMLGTAGVTSARTRCDVDQYTDAARLFKWPL